MSEPKVDYAKLREQDRVKKETEVTHAIGTAKAQTKISDPRPGNGKQILFSKFDSNWITEVRNIKE